VVPLKQWVSLALSAPLALAGGVVMQKRSLGIIGIVFVPWVLYAATVRVHITDHQGTAVGAAEVQLVNSQSGETKNKLQRS
jgi:hypothetical protein